MNNSQFEQLKTENDDLQRALIAVEKHLETTLGKCNFQQSQIIFCYIAEKDQINTLYDDFRGHYN